LPHINVDDHAQHVTGGGWPMTAIRPVFYVSDGTGITAETIGHSLLTQFSGFQFLTDRLAFVDDPDKAREACGRIHAAGL
jgi:regulator of PEP synthase PpsR (kinase-PPPase family)